MKLIKSNMIDHNFYNEKVMEWVIENFEPYTDQRKWGCRGSNDWGCNCVVEEIEEGKFYICDSEGNTTDTPYMSYYDKLDAEDLVKAIPNLTEDEKEDILDVINVRIYACPICNGWAMDGDNC